MTKTELNCGKEVRSLTRELQNYTTLCFQSRLAVAIETVKAEKPLPILLSLDSCGSWGAGFHVKLNHRESQPFHAQEKTYPIKPRQDKLRKSTPSGYPLTYAYGVPEAYRRQGS